MSTLDKIKGMRGTTQSTTNKDNSTTVRRLQNMRSGYDDDYLKQIADQASKYNESQRNKLIGINNVISKISNSTNPSQDLRSLNAYNRIRNGNSLKDYAAQMSRLNTLKTAGLLSDAETDSLKKESANLFSTNNATYKTAASQAIEKIRLNDKDYLTNSDASESSKRKEVLENNNKRLEEINSQINELEKLYGNSSINYRNLTEEGKQKSTELTLLKNEKSEIEKALQRYNNSANYQYDNSLEWKNDADYATLSKQRNIGDNSLDSQAKLDPNNWYQDSFSGKTYTIGGEEVTEANIAKWKEGDKLGTYLNSTEDEKKNSSIATSYIENSKKEAIDAGTDKYWDKLTDEEIDNYYYQYNKNGQQAASDYLDSIQHVLDKRAYDEQEQKINDSMLTREKLQKMKDSGASNAEIFNTIQDFINQGTWETAKTVFANIFGGPLAGISDYVNLLFNGDMNPYNKENRLANYANLTRGAYGNAIADLTGSQFMGDLYGATTSTLDSAAGALIGGSAYGASMGLGAAAQSMKELYEEGATPGQVLMVGTLAGVFEGLFEKYSLEKLLDTKDIAKPIKTVINSMIAEGSEESFTDLANNVADFLLRGDQSKFMNNYVSYLNAGYSQKDASMSAVWDDVKGALKSGLFGAISGGAFGTVNTSINYSNYRSNVQAEGNRIIQENYNEKLDNLVKIVETDESNDTRAKKLLDNAQKAFDAYKADESNTRLREKAVNAIGELSTYLDTKLQNSNEQYVSDVLQKENPKLKGEALEELTAAVMAKAAGVQNQQIENLIEKHGITGDTINSVREYLTKTNTKLQAGRLGLEIDENGNPTEESIRSFYQSIYEKAANNRAAGEDKSALSLSDTGADINNKTNEDIKIKSISSVEGGMQLELEDGSLIKAEDVSFANNDDAVILSKIKDMKITAEQANELWQAYENLDHEKIPATTYALAIQEAYDYGRVNVNETNSFNMLFAKVLPENIQNMAYEYGKISKQTETDNQTYKIKELAERGINNVKGNLNMNNVNLAAADTAKGKRQTSSIKVLDKLAETLNVKFNLYESYKGADGKLYADIGGKRVLAPNGYYNSTDNTLWIDINAGNNGEGLMLYTASHEITHFIAQWSPDKFKVLADFLIEQYQAKNVSVASLVNAQIMKNKAAGNIISREEAFEEVVADSMQMMLSDEQALNKIYELKTKDKSLVQKMHDWLSKTFAAVKEAYADVKPYSQEARIVSEMGDKLEDLKNLFAEALVTASNNFVHSGDIDYAKYFGVKNTDGNQMFQVRAFMNDEQGYRNLLEKYTDMSKEQLDGLFSMLDRVSNFILEHPEALDFGTDANLNEDGEFDDSVDARAFDTLKQNSDKLYKLSLDFSTLCRKRVLQQTVQIELQARLGRNISQAEQVAIRKELQQLHQEGLDIEVACALCYVEAARFKSNNQIAKFLASRKSMEDVVRQYLGGKSATTLKNEAEAKKRAEMQERQDALPENEKMRFSDGSIIDFTDKKTASLKALPDNLANEIRDAKRKVLEEYVPNADEQRILNELDGLSVNDFVSPEGLEELKKNHREVFDAYTSYVRNATKAKGIENDTWYRLGDTKALSDKMLENMNAENGLRTQSWSDFQVIHLMDYIAATLELSARGAKEQAYTKVPDYVKLMGNTGTMINLSLIPTANYDGTLQYDPVEGMPFETALELRDKYPETTGTICIGDSEKQIKQLLESLDIDYVIPYHHSGANAHLRHALGIPGWVSFQNFQSEKTVDYVPDGYTKDTANWHKSPNFSDWYSYEEAVKIQKAEEKNPSRPDLKAKYGVQYSGYMAMHQMAENYKRICYERGLQPKFSTASKTVSGDFTNDFNYWKLLIDRKMVNQKTGEIIEQKKIQPIFNENSIMEILNDELNRYGKIKAHQDYATDSIVKMFMKGIEDGTIDKKGNFAKSASNVVEKESDTIAKALRNPIDDIAIVNAVANGNEIKNSVRSKEEMFDIIQRANPMTDDYHRGIRSIEDIKTPMEAFITDVDLDENYVYPDFTQEDGRKAIDSGIVTVYSSRPITTGSFVSTSEMMAKDYAGNEKVYSQKVSIYDVAWLDSDEGQIAITNGDNSRNLVRYSFRDSTTGMANDGLIPFDEERKKTIESEGNIVVDSFQKIVDSVHEAFADRSLQKVLYFGKISNDLMKKIDQDLQDKPRELQNKNIFTNEDDYELVAPYNAIVHVVDEKPWLNIDDVIALVDRLCDTILNYSEAKYSKYQRNGAHGIKFKQYYDNDVFVGSYDIVGNNKKTIYLQSVYADFGRNNDRDYLKKKSVADRLNETNPLSRTPEAVSGQTSSDENITSKENDVKRSIRDLSDRELLASGMESIATTKNQQEILQVYKDKLEALRGWQNDKVVAERELHKLRNQETKDLVAIKAMKERIDSINKKFMEADRQLLKMEKLKPIRDIIDAERNRLSQMSNEKIAEFRKNYTQKIDAIVAKNRESRQKSVESRNATKVRNAIKKDLSVLRQFLNRGNDKRNVKEDLKDTVGTALNTFTMMMLPENYQSDLDIVKNLSTDKYPEYATDIANYIKYSDAVKNAIDGKAKNSAAYQLNKIKPKLRDIIKTEREILNRSTVSNALTNLSDAYAEVKNSEYSYIRNAYDEDVKAMIDSLKDEIGGTLIKDATSNQLLSIHKVLRAVTTTVRNANKFFGMEKYASVESASNNAINEIRKNAVKTPKSGFGESLSAFLWNNEKPIYAFEKIKSEVLLDLFKNIRNAEDTWVINISKAKDYFQQKADKYNYDSWDFEKTFEFEDSINEGEKFKLTLGQMMSLYAYSRRGEQATRHLTIGGFVYDPNTEFKDGKKKVKANDANAYHMTYDTLTKITNSLTSEQRQFVQEMQNYLSYDLAELGNQTSMQLLGINLFTEQNYFPLQSAEQYNAFIGEDGKDVPVRIKKYGFTKNLTKNASNPVVLNNFMDVWSKHSNEMSMYNAFTLPLDNFNKVYNYKTIATEETGAKSLQATLENAQGKAAINYINTLLNDINGGARMDSREGVFARLMSRFKMTAVAANLQVVIQQPSAVGRAFAMIDAKYFIPSDIKINYSQAIEEMHKYAPVSIIKEMGYFDTDMGMTSQDFIQERAVKGAGNIVNKLLTDSEYRTDAMNKATGYLPGKADEVTWVAMWKATKRMIADTRKDLKVGSEEFLKAVGEKYTDMIVHTQVYDSVLSRSANMRSKSGAMKMVTAFMAEPTTTANMVEYGLSMIKDNPKLATRTLGSVATAILINSLLKSITSAARDKDEDETYAEKYMQSFTESMLDGFNPLTYLPYVKDVWSLIQGYDVERSDMTLISEVVDKVNKFRSAIKSTSDNRDEKIADAGLNLGLSVLNLMGIPAKAVYRDASSIANVFNTFNNGAKTTPGTLSKAIGDTISEYFSFLKFSPEKAKSDKLYEAIIGTDREMQRRLEQSYKSDSALETAIVKGLRENDDRIQKAADYRLAGDTANYMKIAKQIIAEGNFSQDEVVKAINYYVNKANEDKSDSETSTKAKQMYSADDFINALVQGDSSTADEVMKSIISTNVANGKTEEKAKETFVGSIPNKVKEAYLESKLTDDQVAEILSEYAEKDEKKINDYISKWSFEKSYGFDYDDLNVALDEGNISYEDAINTVMSVKGYDYNKAKDRVDYLIFGNENPTSDISQNTYAAYTSKVKDAGISIDDFEDFYERAKELYADVDKNGKAISGSKKKKVIALIDSLPLTADQKDALYYYEGYSKSTLKKDAPWR